MSNISPCHLPIPAYFNRLDHSHVSNYYIHVFITFLSRNLSYLSTISRHILRQRRRRFDQLCFRLDLGYYYWVALLYRTISGENERMYERRYSDRKVAQEEALCCLLGLGKGWYDIVMERNLDRRADGAEGELQFSRSIWGCKLNVVMHIATMKPVISPCTMRFRG